eukprot:c9675_g1_i1.p1 GENE.c9675_g1_i1~~c9675_g1_i1.p1  ORF type:complete len:510 (-),score=99.53 c9675_g1_i1:131-1660(-)
MILQLPEVSLPDTPSPTTSNTRPPLPQPPWPPTHSTAPRPTTLPSAHSQPINITKGLLPPPLPLAPPPTKHLQLQRPIGLRPGLSPLAVKWSASLLLEHSVPDPTTLTSLCSVASSEPAIFAREFDSLRSRVKSPVLPKSVFTPLVAIVRCALRACEASEDFTTAKILMQVAGTYACADETGSRRGTLIQVSVRGEAIFKMERFWVSAFYESLAVELRRARRSSFRGWAEVSEKEREMQLTEEELVIFGQIGPFALNMLSFAVPLTVVVPMVKRFSSLTELSDEHATCLKQMLWAYAETQGPEVCDMNIDDPQANLKANEPMFTPRAMPQPSPRSVTAKPEASFTANVRKMFRSLAAASPTPLSSPRANNSNSNNTAPQTQTFQILTPGSASLMVVCEDLVLGSVLVITPNPTRKIAAQNSAIATSPDVRESSDEDGSDDDDWEELHEPQQLSDFRRVAAQAAEFARKLRAQQERESSGSTDLEALLTPTEIRSSLYRFSKAIANHNMR